MKLPGHTSESWCAFLSFVLLRVMYDKGLLAHFPHGILMVQRIHAMQVLFKDF